MRTRFEVKPKYNVTKDRVFTSIKWFFIFILETQRSVLSD